MTKAFSVLLVVLAAALSSVTGLATPAYNVRRQLAAGNGTGTDQDSICPGSSPTLVSTSSIAVGNATLELTKFSCATTSTTPFVSAHKAQDPLLAWLEGLFWWLFPDCPPVKPNPPKKTTTKTVTKATTATKTVTSVSVSLSTTTATESATVTEVSTATSATTIIETETESATATITETVTAASPTSTAKDVCGEICTTVCGELGQLPPTTDDCQQLVNSITILNGQIAPEFTVESNHVQTITFGTCRFFFENVSPEPLTYCWLSLAQVASAAASACLPPTQPVMSEGLCLPSDGTWEVGVAHS
ncbi:hypothetical protein L226DRAFT_614483 [Lentinus tigrinus ALCF2SS1-7]|uniref:Uncharacterized protein n=1 Tax=Lentinus tigrinus ALCF2SS1-6 TaxID=1328759 RepID=A0A5C2S3S9_9APHY|nr:hypothetical protein L227DRAFT_577314 [Lentinus tigrinus ALCF2SS1-6]RPD72907.1 hypothetical protein L226DRAFT_614483 [Lentinus tigrinus ALCF2SS1-7]